MKQDLNIFKGIILGSLATSYCFSFIVGLLGAAFIFLLISSLATMALIYDVLIKGGNKYEKRK
jgi:hypothetical protein